MTKNVKNLYNKHMTIWLTLAKYATFETEVLRLRPLRFDDRYSFFSMLIEDELPFIFPKPKTRQECDELFVQQFMKAPLGIWGIELKASEELIGVIQFEKIDLNQNSAELAYFLKRDYWGRGLMTECVKNISFLGLKSCRLARINIIVHKENIASKRVAEKCHYRLVGSYKGSDRYTHKIRNYLTYELRAGVTDDE